MEFTGSFCVDCAVARGKDLFKLERKLALRVCAHCGKAFVKGEWKPFSRQLLGELLASRVKASVPFEASLASLEKVKGGFSAVLDISLEHVGKRLSRHAVVAVAVDSNACHECRMKSGGYHEAVIQLRGDLAKCRKVAERVRRAVEGSSFVSGVEERKEGIDMLVGSRRAAVEALSRLRLRNSISRKLIGQREGKRVYRLSACVRL